ncbi:hypothetical protein J6590_007056 [Homalodisca vitripennis]|nr:hypothetical protein J6590_007056 [Homalodisca vitripennis]
MRRKNDSVKSLNTRKFMPSILLSLCVLQKYTSLKTSASCTLDSRRSGRVRSTSYEDAGVMTLTCNLTQPTPYYGQHDVLHRQQRALLLLLWAVRSSARLTNHVVYNRAADIGVVRQQRSTAVNSRSYPNYGVYVVSGTSNRSNLCCSFENCSFVPSPRARPPAPVLVLWPSPRVNIWCPYTLPPRTPQGRTRSSMYGFLLQYIWPF